MVDKLTPRLGLPEPFLTNPLKVDVGRLQQALEMIDANAVMLTDWDITADGWQKMGTIKGLAQGKIAASLMVVTGTGFANILFQTGDGTVTTVGDPARMTVSAQTSLGANAPTILGGRVVETAADEYEIWFNIAIGTSPRKWSGLLITGNGATIDWTHAMSTQPSDGVELQISRVLTSFDVASDTRTDIGTLLSTGHLGSGVVQLDYLTTVDLKGRLWKTGELVRIKKADATDAKGFPPALVSADPSATGWFIRCLSINDTRTVKEFEFTSESAGIIRAYKARLSGTTWSVAKVYTSLDKPTANDISALGMRAPVTGTDVVNLNDMYGPDYYGATAIKSTASAVAANNYPFDEVGTVLVLPFGDTFSCTQLYVTQSGRVAARSYDGSTWTTWRKQANSGVNDDITSMTGLTGPLKLGGDGVGDYDAVTMRQLKASSGGSGPTMNGVVNNFLGAVEWWNGSRAKTPAGYVPADGQLLKRADYPEIWAAIKAGILNSVSDTLWRGDKNANPESFGKHRAKYSLGYKADGATDGTFDDGETFRMPDLNGVKVDGVNGWAYGTSSPALHLRGDTFGVDGTTEAGTVSRNAAPDITGASISAFSTSTSLWDAMSGAFGLDHGNTVTQVGNQATIATAGAARKANMSFKASRSAASYGRDNTTEVRPNSAVGIWLIRVGGSFAAASTNFSVFNGDTTLPGNNTEIRGGAIRSVYQVAGADHMSVEVRAQGTVGGVYTPVIEMVSPSGGAPVTRRWSLPQVASELVGRDSIGTSGAKIPLLSTVNAWSAIQDFNERISQWTFPPASSSTGDYINAHGLRVGLRGRGGKLDPTGGFASFYYQDNVNVKVSAIINLNAYRHDLSWRFEDSGNAIAPGSWSPNSDDRLKTNKERIQNPLSLMKELGGYTWTRLDGGAWGIGFIAQEVAKIFPEAVVEAGDRTLDDGTVVKGVLSPDTYGVAAALHHEAILALLARIEVLEAKLKDK